MWLAKHGLLLTAALFASHLVAFGQPQEPEAVPVSATKPMQDGPPPPMMQGPPAPWTPERAAPLLEATLKNVPATGLMIFEVLPGSQADLAGFRPGDVLTHYDGQPVHTTDMISKLFRRMGAEGRKTALVIIRRGQDDIEAQFDFAPLGVRLVPVKQGTSRVLQPVDTVTEPNIQPVRALLQAGSRFELLYPMSKGMPGDKPVGWAREYFLSKDGRLYYRRQQAAHAGDTVKREDMMIEFAFDRYLSPQRYWLAVDEKLILDFRRASGQWVGMRVGIPLRVDLPMDTVVDVLAGYVAATMATQPSACLRCSYLDSVNGSHTPAPFGALVGVQWEKLEVAKRDVPAFRFDQLVLGDRVASFWVDANGSLVACHRGDGFHSVMAAPDTVGLHFPKDGNLFPPINQLPGQ